jgi:hypothetical protein
MAKHGHINHDGRPKPRDPIPGELDRWPHPACLDEPEFLAHCEAVAGRAGGPGGQNRNKVSTHITLTFRPTGHAAQAGERRSQQENRAIAAKRLRIILAVEHRVSVPKGRGLAILDLPAGSPLWRSRVHHRRIICNTDHWDFPAVLAEAMDVLADMGWDPRRAALMLDVTASQLIKLLAQQPEALARLNDERQQRGQHALKIER